MSDGSGEEYVMEEARIASSAMGCYAYKLGGVSRGGLSNILPNISGQLLLRSWPTWPGGEVDGIYLKASNLLWLRGFDADTVSR